jgi:hypothetical protein
MDSRFKRLISSIAVASMFWAGLVSASYASQYPGPEFLVEGVQNEYVEMIQKALVQLGYEISPTNGRYGPQTVNAISKFYNSVGDRSDGTSLGPAGYKAIINSASAQAEEPVKSKTKKKTKSSKGSKSATRARFREMGDVTLTGGTRKSRAAREQISFEQWKAAPFTKFIATKESNRRCKAVNRSGKYRGRWQMDKNFWSSYGGKKFAKRPERASCAEQDLVAYRGWIARGWQPWNY